MGFGLEYICLNQNQLAQMINLARLQEESINAFALKSGRSTNSALPGGMMNEYNAHSSNPPPPASPPTPSTMQ